jgi:hypothetical protein
VRSDRTLPGPKPGGIAERAQRLVLALRALDDRLEKGSYRDIAEALFGSSQMPDRGWKPMTFAIRPVRLARLGFSLMQTRPPPPAALSAEACRGQQGW